MKRLALTLAAVAALAVLAVAAPALTLVPHRPAPVDFEIAAPGASAASAGPVVSSPLRAPKRFDLVGFRWKGDAEPSLAVRTRRSGGRWSRWTAVGTHADHAPEPDSGERSASGTSDPVWAGGADWVQYRLSRRPAGLRLHFVNTTGTATAADRARTAIRGAVGRAVSFVLGPAAARAQGQPDLVTRDGWGADSCRPRSAPSYGEVEAALVHHTVSTNDYLPEDGPAAVLAICRYHRNSNGWDDIGYNFVVDRYGVIYEGRAGGIDRAVVGAQTQGFNAQTTGIANLGTYSDVPQTDAAMDAMARLIRWKLPLHGAPTSGRVMLVSGGGSANRHASGAQVPFERVSGHRDAGRTACPGDGLYSQLPDLRARVAGATPGPRATRTKVGGRVSRATRTITYPGPANVGGRLLRMTGEPIGGAAVEVQLRGPDGYVPVGTGQTAADGSFHVEASPPFSGLMRVRYFGGEALRASSSKRMRIRVRPRITLERSVSRAEVGRTPIVEGAIDPPRTRVTIVVERRVGRRDVRVASYRLRPRGGVFRKGHRLRAPGLYRFRAVFTGDGLNRSASSASVYVRAVENAGTSAGR